MRGFFNSVFSYSAENRFALLIDNLAAFVQRNAGGIFDTGTTICADKAVLFQLAIDRLRDNTTNLILSAFAVRRCDNQKILVLKASGFFWCCWRFFR